MSLRDACNQPVSLAWIGNICSRVALETWGWHHCSPVSPPSSGQCYCWSRSPPPLSPFTAGCAMTVTPTPHQNGVFCGHLLLHQNSVTLNWTERKATECHCSLCQSSVALLLLWMAFLAPFTPPTNPNPAAEISSRPAWAWASWSWRVPFFVLSVTDVFFLTWTLPYTWFSSRWKRELSCRVLTFSPSPC